MLFSKTLAAAIMATSVSAAAVVKRDETWTLDGLHRDCKQDGSQCTWSFKINNGKDATDCSHVVNSQNGASAARSHGGPTYCGNYRLESSWDSHFGDDKGFSVIGVLDQSRQVIAFFGFDDNEVANNRVVQPNHKGNVQPFHQ